MKKSVRVGFSFGLTSGVITTLGLMIGLNSSTNSKIVVIGGILTIAIADALSDSMGIHIAAESQNKHSVKDIWEATISTFSYKFIFSSIFIIPVVLFELCTAVPICILIGLYLIFASSLVIAREQKTSAWKVIGEHLILTIIVIIVAHFVGLFIAQTFGTI
jgi:VIT1/CCC1 family predicted Fe2+/Mn2+ transporter